MINVMKKEIIHLCRDKKSFALMVLLPIVLISILGFALGRNFESSGKIDDIKILYTIKENSICKEPFFKFKEELKDKDINFIEIKNENKGKKYIANSDYSGYIILEKDEIKFYKNNRYNFKGSLVENLLNTFKNKFNIITQVIKLYPDKIQYLNNTHEKELCKIEGLNNKRSPKALDYYAVTMTTNIILYSSLYGAFSLRNEKFRKTYGRILCTSVKKHEIFLGKLIGISFVCIIQMFMIVFFSKYVLKAYFGNNLVPIILLLIAEVFMSISFGIAMGFVIKNNRILSPLINYLINLFVFLGGGYIPVDNLGGKFFNNITQISPITHINKGIFKFIYSNDIYYLNKSIFMLLIISFISLIISSVLLRKEDI